MEIPTDIPPGFFDSILSGIPSELRALMMLGLGLLAIAIVIKLIGKTIRAVISLAILGGAAAIFVYITHQQGWIDWPFYDGGAIDIPDLPTRDDLPTLDDLPTPN